ncbi:uncharacterized protein LOC119785847 isoform X2 [Cyprinodon tularosa]|uniref:uncharacterized protein LOC119785847 isoform X2 n=1 Tax=Cyprinodon tularosa TaxID=77115 RepID=UPI0018E202E0|nr:uncharacterized protein LOC119785847 isoform X2 [Cyprinodon tularosa]
MIFGQRSEWKDSTFISALTGPLKKSPLRRQCSIHITNLSDRFTLENPRMYSCRGSCVDPLPPRILPSSSGGAVFAKTPRTGRGFSGISTYDLFNGFTEEASEQIVILFKVPYDLNFRANEYAVGVFDVSEKLDKFNYENLTKSMEKRITKGQAKGPSLIHKDHKVAIRATMSDCTDPIIKVHISDN